MSESLLLIDDDQSLLTVMERAFTRRGFQVFTTASVAEANVLARNHSFDKAVLDLKIDQDSGLLLLPELLSLQPDLQVVIVTGYSSVATAVEAIKLGAVNYLCKPVNADEILAVFERREGNPDVDLTEQVPSVNRLEWEHIQKVLAECDGNISATARKLGMHRRTLQRKLQKRPVKV